MDNIKYGRERQSNDVFADESGHAMNIPEKFYCLQNGMLILSKTPQVQLHVVCVVRGVLTVVAQPHLPISLPLERVAFWQTVALKLRIQV